MIEIRVTDPYATPPSQLRAVAALLMQIAGDEATAEHLNKSVTTAGQTIAPADNPATGAQSPNDADPEVVFGKAGNTLPAGATSTSTAAAPAIGSSQAAATSAASASDVDADGLPWDSRIHSSTKARNADGRWRTKRNLPDGELERVAAELRAVMGNAPVAASPAALVPASPTAVVPPPPPPAVPADAGNVPPPPPGAPAVAAAIPAAPATNPTTASPATGAPVQSAPMTFAQFALRVHEAVRGGQLTQEQVGAVLAANNCASLPTLAAFPHLVPAIAQQLGFV